MYGKILLETSVRKLQLADNSFQKVRQTAPGYTTLSVNPQVTGLFTIIGQADVARFQSRIMDAVAFYREALTVDPHHAGVKDQLQRIHSEVFNVAHMLSK
jgi:hypothetical protein